MSGVDTEGLGGLMARRGGQMAWTDPFWLLMNEEDYMLVTSGWVPNQQQPNMEYLRTPSLG